VFKIPQSTKKNKTKKQIIDELHNNRMNCDEFNKKTLDRACEKLAEELYSTRTHFFYELIQNAEDNIYSKNKKPHIEFEIHPEYLLIKNNEKGFLERDVNSISDIGLSDKEKSEFRHDIGEKGIGFKSVFGITDTPKIFSNGFKFKFDAKVKLGYIMPTWISKLPNYINSSLTNIYLPLNQKGKEVIQNFREIDPEIILFLDKLKIITVNNNITEEHFKIQKNVKNKSIQVRISSGEEPIIKEFLHFEKEYDRPLDLKEKNREKKKKSKLELAFPIHEDKSFDLDSGGRIFSFLPIDSYDRGVGFPFYIQGDFLLTSNRSEIQTENEWNLWLRNNLIDILMESIEFFKQSDLYKFTFLNLIPSEENIRDIFFQNFADDIETKLKESACIFGFDNNWNIPADIYIADAEILDLIPNSVINKYLGGSFAHPKFITSLIDEKNIIERLEIKHFTFNHLIEILKNKEWLKSKSDEWFIKLYSYFGKKLQNSEIQAKEFDFLEIFRLEDESLVDTKVKYLYLRAKDGKGRMFDGKFNYMKEKFYENLESEEDSDESPLVVFFRENQIDRVTPEIIVSRIFIGLYEDDLWKNKETDQLIEVISFIKTYFSELKPVTKDNIIQVVYLQTNSTDKYGKPKDLYLPFEYQTKFDLKSLFLPFKEQEECFVSGDYLENCDPSELEEWREFFYILGVNKVLKPAQKKVAYSSLSEEYQNQIEYPNYPRVQNVYLFDYYFPFKFALKENPFVLLNYLSENWDELKSYLKKTLYYETKSKTKKVYKYNEELDLKAEWFREIQDIPWISTTNNLFMKPSDVFLPIKILSQYVVGDIPILDLKKYSVDISENKEFLNDLGIKFELTISIVLDYIKNLKNTKIKDQNLYFKAYYYLNENYDEDSEIIDDFFKNGAYIFIPSSKKNKDHFFTIDELIWDKKFDQGVHKRFWAFVEGIYPNLEKFFVSKLGVTEFIDLEEYCRVFREIISDDTIELSSWMKQYIQLVYKQINDGLSFNFDDFKNEPWWEEFSNLGILLVQHNAFWTNDNDLFYNDDDELFRIFENDSNIGFIEVNRKNFPQLKEFFQYFNIKPLSESLHLDLIDTKGNKPLSKISLLLQKSIPYIIRFIYSINNKLFLRLKTQDFISSLTKIECVQVGQIKIKITLTNVGPESLEITHKIIRDYSLIGNTIYLTKENSMNLDFISLLISNNYFEKMPGLDDFISNILHKLRNGPKIDNKWLEIKNLYHLPSEELVNFTKFFGTSDLEIIFGDNIAELEKENNEIYDSDEDFEISDEDTLYLTQDEIFPDNFISDEVIQPEISQEFNDKSENIETRTLNQYNENLEENTEEKNQISLHENNLSSGIKTHQIERDGVYYNFNQQPNNQNIQELPAIEDVNANLEEFSSNVNPDINLENLDEDFINLEEIKSLTKKNARNTEILESDNAKEDYKFEGNIGESESSQINLQFNESDPALKNMQNEKLQNLVGIRGEEIVFRTLIQTLKEKYARYEVIQETYEYLELSSSNNSQIILKWENAGNSESFKSYDLILYEKNIKKFIEVKSTKSKNKSSFLISGSEWNIAKIVGENYYIYRVFDCLSINPRIVIIQNPYQKWLDGLIIANPVKLKF